MAGGPSLRSSRPTAGSSRPVGFVGLSQLGWGVVSAWSAALSLVLLRPMLHSGYGLGHDLVFTPQQPLDAGAIGLSSAAPRAVPVDALVALAEHLVGGAVVFRLAVVLPLLAVGLGAVAALRPRHLAGAVTCASFAIWNPFVVERLAIGHWALLWSYAAVPWLLVAARWQWRLRLALTVVAVAAASITPTGGLIAGALAALLALLIPSPGRAGSSGRTRQSVVLVAVAAALQLPWVLPAVLSAAGSTSDPAAVAAFASRADIGPGVVGSLLAGAGIWNADVVPGSRTGWLGVLAVAVAVGCAGLGWRGVRRSLGRGATTALGGLSAAGLVLALLGAWPGGAALLRAVVSTVPGAGLLRDGQKWVLPLVLAGALLAGAAADAVWAWLSSQVWRGAAAVAFVVLPLVVLPDAAATVAPTLRPVHYPADWTEVRRLTAGGGDAVVLPFAAYRAFSWAPGRPVLDPAPRLLATPVVVDDRLSVSGRLLRGEDRRSLDLAQALAAPGDLGPALGALGVRWVVVEHGTPGVVPPLETMEAEFQGRDVSLYRISEVRAAPGPARWRVGTVVVADLLALGGSVAALGVLLTAGTGRFVRTRRRRDA